MSHICNSACIKLKIKKTEEMEVEKEKNNLAFQHFQNNLT